MRAKVRRPLETLARAHVLRIAVRVAVEHEIAARSGFAGPIAAEDQPLSDLLDMLEAGR
jgi:hypothetical protein